LSSPTLFWWEEKKRQFRELRFKVFRPMKVASQQAKWVCKGILRKHLSKPRGVQTRVVDSEDYVQEEKRAIEIVNDQNCRVKVGNDWLYFKRRCPHKGADLVQGEIQGNRILCAWHNVSFSLQNGTSDCPGIAALQLKKETDSQSKFC
jgi:nitrite reductase/ring-hydroxylating ferredoxin subunit